MAQDDIVYQYSTTATTYITTFDCENANVFETELDANTTVVFSNPPASGTPVVNGYLLSSASYDSVSFSVSSQEIQSTDVTFGDSGTKMYIIGYNTDTVYQYTLTTAYDISTASYASKSFSVTTQDGTPRGVDFNSSGTKMYVCGQTTDAFYQYSLSTAWDVSTASYDSVSLSVSGQDGNPMGFTFKPDGTKLFLAGSTNDSIFQYSLSTAFDLSTASYDSVSFSVASQDTGPVDVLFNNDGTKMFVGGSQNDSVYQYSLSTAYDVSTASYDSVSLSTTSQASNPTGIAFNGDGTKLFVVGQTNNTVYQYTVGTSTLNDSTAYAMSLKVVQDSGASGFTVTWPTSVDWPAATAPTLTATASAVDQFVFYTYDGGTTWYGFTAGQALG
jgi:6-phosphogluconolactonase (cycloisomerase 2 family)